METNTYKTRLKAELDELTERTDKLLAFIVDSPVYKSLDQDRKYLLTQQHHHMVYYRDILRERCALEGIEV